MEGRFILRSLHCAIGYPALGGYSSKRDTESWKGFSLSERRFSRWRFSGAHAIEKERTNPQEYPRGCGRRGQAETDLSRIRPGKNRLIPGRSLRFDLRTPDFFGDYPPQENAISPADSK
jgi:hypothetical protein